MEREPSGPPPAEIAQRARTEMVQRQLRDRGIRDEAVLAAMAAVPREQFVPPDYQRDAYSDAALGIASGQTISQPYIVARMTELIRPRPGMHVLEIGTGSGYQAAVLATIGCEVLSIERIPDLAVAAQARIERLGLAHRVTIRSGDGSLGAPDAGPFAGILVTAAAPRVPGALLQQLDDGARLVAPVGARSHQELLVVTRHGQTFEEHSDGPCVFVPLLGEDGFSDVPAEPHRRWF